MGVQSLLDVSYNGVTIRDMGMLLNYPNGLKLCIDMSVVVHRLIHIIYDKNTEYSNTRAEFTEKLYQYLHMLSYNNTIICVFDGEHKKKKSLQTKRFDGRKKSIQRKFVDKELDDSSLSAHTLVVRGDTTEYYINNYPIETDFELCKLVVKQLQIPFYISHEQEAETLAVLLCRELKYDAVLSTDTDVLMYNGNLLKPLNGEFIYFNMCNILDTFHLTYEEFLKICLILGCDFCTKSPRIGPKTVLKKFRNVLLTKEQQAMFNEVISVVPNTTIQHYNISLVNLLKINHLYKFDVDNVECVITTNIFYVIDYPHEVVITCNYRNVDLMINSEFISPLENCSPLENGTPSENGYRFSGKIESILALSDIKKITLKITCLNRNCRESTN